MAEPHVPPVFSSHELPAMALEAGPEAFCVDEIPSYLPGGEGPHLYVRVQKRSLTTQDAIRLVARAAGVAPRDVGSAGQKDRDAVTTQWLSLPESASDPASWDLPAGVRILETGRHRNKLRTGHVQANRFALRFDVDPGAVDAIRDVLATLEREGMPNYFGPQRFGRGGRNLAKALAWARGELRLRGRDARFETKLYASVLQSEVFNRYVSARLSEAAPLLDGEVVRLEGSRSVFVVDDPAAELPRLLSGDIVATGPMPGPKTRRAERDAGALEVAAGDSLGLSEDAWRAVGRDAPGTRRDLRVRPTDVGAEVAGPRTVVVQFTLPSGAYATQLARELTRRPWHEPLRSTLDE